MSSTEVVSIRVKNDVIEDFPLKDLRRIPYFNGIESMEGSFDNISEVVLKGPEIEFKPLDIILSLLKNKENREQINDCGTLRAIRHTADFLCIPEIMEDFIRSEKNSLNADYFIIAKFPVNYIVKHYHGFTPEQFSLFKKSGYKIKELMEAGFNCKVLKNLGYEAEEFKGAGLSALQLRGLAFSARTLKEIGLSAKKLKKAGYSAYDLKEAGFSARELYGLNFSVLQLKKAGFSALELKKLNISALQLSNARFSAWELKEAGFSVLDLKEVGFSIRELNDAEFSPSQLKEAGFTVWNFVHSTRCYYDSNNCFEYTTLKELGFSIRECHEAHLPIRYLIYAGFETIQILQEVKLYSDQLLNAEISASQFIEAGISIGKLKELGFSVYNLRGVGFSIAEIMGAKFQYYECRRDGISAKDILRVTKLEITSMQEKKKDNPSFFSSGLKCDVLLAHYNQLRISADDELQEEIAKTCSSCSLS